MRPQITSASVLFAALTLTGSAGAATFTWQGTSGSTTSWSDTTRWLDEGNNPGAPGAGDLAQLHVSVTANTLINIGSGASVGSISARPSSGLYRIRSTDAGTRTFTLDNAGSESLITVGHSANFAFSDGLLQIGTDVNAINLALANDVRITNDGSRLPSGRFQIGDRVTITGGSLADRRTITTQSLGSGGIRTIVNSAATFVGDWVVDGAKATLDMNADSFGDASNSVTLRNGGLLDLNDLGAYAWTRSLSGNGSVSATGGLTISNDGVLSPGESIGTLNITAPSLTFDAGSLLSIELEANQVSDLVAVTGAVMLGGELSIATLGGYTPAVGDSWTILSATDGINGTFAAPLPAGFSVGVVGNDLVLSYVPEPGAALAMTGLLGLMVRRRRAAQRQ